MTQELGRGAPPAPPNPLPVRSRSAKKPSGKLCGICHVDFPGVLGYRLTWCLIDEVYVCPRCLSLVCRKKHAGSKHEAMSSLTIISALAFTLALFLPVALVGVYDSAQAEYHRGLPTTPIRDLQPGGMVKVVATIDSTGVVALGGHQASTRGGYRFEWDRGVRFQLEDSTGSVLATNAEFYEIERATHPSTRTPRAPGTEYLDGDRVIAAGKVRLEGGSLLFVIRYFAPEGGTHSFHGLPAAGTTMLVVPFVLLAAAGSKILVKRALAHRSKLRGVSPDPLPPDRAFRPADTQWRPNRLYHGNVNRRSGMAAAVVLGAGLLLLVPILPGTDAWGTAAIAFGAGWVVLLLLYAPIVAGLAPSPLPSEVGISPRGLHLWYEPPPFRHFNRLAVEWSAVSGARVIEGKQSSWKLETTSGPDVQLTGVVDEENVSRIRDAWKRLKPETPAALPPAPAVPPPGSPFGPRPSDPEIAALWDRKVSLWLKNRERQV